MLLCAPSMGILDNWLPVLHAARAEHPDWRIVALIPDRETLAQLDPDDTAHVLADEVIDATVAPLVGGRWILTAGFLAAAGAAEPRRLLRRWRTRQQRSGSVELSSLAGPATRLLYDVRLHAKHQLEPVLATMGDTPRFSHNHGIELEKVDARRVAPPDPGNVRATFLYGAGEAAAHVTNFALPPASLVPVGVARHDPAWVAEVRARSAALHRLPFERFVFVVSRPAGSPYLPYDRKVAALRAIHRVAWEEHGLPIVLRTHPKEHEDGTLAAGLPPEGEGTSWARSHAHPFHLASRSTLGITFLSGVAVDLIALGVPVIEFLDVRDLAPYDTPDAPRDHRGRPRFGPYRRDGLVLPADDVDDLRATFARILADREGAVTELRASIAARFTPTDDAIRTMLATLSG